MKRKVLTKTFIMTSQLKKPFGLYGLCKSIQALYGILASNNNYLSYEGQCNNTALQSQKSVSAHL